jgi:hypothetical protein
MGDSKLNGKFFSFKIKQNGNKLAQCSKHKSATIFRSPPAYLEALFPKYPCLDLLEFLYLKRD